MFAYKFIRKTQESFTSKFVKILVVKLAVLRINFLARCRDTSGVFLFLSKVNVSIDVIGGLLGISLEH